MSTKIEYYEKLESQSNVMRHRIAIHLKGGCLFKKIFQMKWSESNYKRLETGEKHNSFTQWTKIYWTPIMSDTILGTYLQKINNS